MSTHLDLAALLQSVREACEDEWALGTKDDVAFWREKLADLDALAVGIRQQAERITELEKQLADALDGVFEDDD